MAMANWLDTGTPITDHFSFNIPKGSKVRIDSKYGIYVGYIEVNPIDTDNPKSITLVKCNLVGPHGEVLPTVLNTRRFFLQEIHEVAIIPSNASGLSITYIVTYEADLREKSEPNQAESEQNSTQ